MLAQGPQYTPHSSMTAAPMIGSTTTAGSLIRRDEAQPHAHSLNRLSKVTGAGIEDAQNLTAPTIPLIHRHFSILG